MESFHSTVQRIKGERRGRNGSRLRMVLLLLRKLRVMEVEEGSFKGEYTLMELTAASRHQTRKQYMIL